VTAPEAAGVFDVEHATALTSARMDFLDEWLPALVRTAHLNTALDAGCGVGYFSRYLADLGLVTVGFDARPGNIVEARVRHPELSFEVQNLEEPSVRGLGVFDLVLCVGLLYHLENPFAGIRNLVEVTGSLLIIESMVTPDAAPIARLVDEARLDNQSLRYAAFVPSQSCLTKMLYLAGFPWVYRAVRLPRHDDFRETRASRRRRTVLAASKSPLHLPFLREAPAPATYDLWEKPWGARMDRMLTFWRRPMRSKMSVLNRRIRRLLPTNNARARGST
jgi:SAM-dependent methyltransferase